ncbi:uncharacterized protein L969DRAFT_46503 [Mixia osmundae IAM 14324]|uniref:J domain-containing protein n=1 Tax=Mixia osmundae (strain CBS 9802 / IAM 14324 / JCM 22182 / KY 12970) TaxID=764103 RepID=G7E634_MIXOS|nr:uncharacterized protein L969DRAFT_46503 [Mixia osmundae IAM 14324]KEI40554.1 hypothetical protein L969DRAFT_46503 [Mixia osmundae IAM 14324]GAA98294.1 hypothetical protein E5Q_04978 [Mixia osmundae IAM 14324]
MEEDPAVKIFGSEDPDLYGALELSSPNATVEEIRKAYRRLALRYHPDKIAKDASAETQEAATVAFQRVGYAYAVLSDEKRRTKFDKTGRTDTSFWDDKGDDGAAWTDYFKELYEEKVTSAKIEEFMQQYRDSDEERADLYQAYTDGAGSLEYIFDHIMGCNILADEERFIDAINAGIKSKSLISLPAWKKALKDTKARDKLRRSARAEAVEAEEMARELGVHETLFKSKGKKGSNKARADDDKENEASGEDALRALIQQRGTKRYDDMLASIESKYGSVDAKGKKGKPGKKAQAEAMPTDEEFERIQAELDAKRKSTSSTPAGRKKARKA